jgi:signal peptidase I
MEGNKRFEALPGKMQNILCKIIDAVAVFIIFCAVLVLLTVLLTGDGQTPSIMGYSMFRVMTGSMEPTIPTDSLIVVRETDPEELAVGDVISFYSRDPTLSGAVNTHRILKIDQEGDQLYFTTKGDANNVADQYITQESDLVGRVVFVSAFLGIAVRLLSNPLIFVPVILLPLVIILVLNLRQTVSLAKKLAKEEEEQAIREALAKLREKQEPKS